MKYTPLIAVTLSLLTMTACVSHNPANSAAKINTLTRAEKAAGWQLLFDGTDFNGLHNFKKEGVSSGWEIQDGAMVNVKRGGDIVTSNQFDWFELQLD